MKISGFILTATIAFALTAAPSRAAFCGPSADVSSIEKLTIQNHFANAGPGNFAINATHIWQIDVDGAYAFSRTNEDKGPVTYYWALGDSGWKFVDSFPPSSWPQSILTRFSATGDSVQSAKPRCMNPNYVPQSSG